MERVFLHSSHPEIKVAHYLPMRILAIIPTQSEATPVMPRELRNAGRAA
jgi:hypothetical protein